MCNEQIKALLNLINKLNQIQNNCGLGRSIVGKPHLDASGMRCTKSCSVPLRHRWDPNRLWDDFSGGLSCNRSSILLSFSKYSMIERSQILSRNIKEYQGMLCTKRFFWHTDLQRMLAPEAWTTSSRRWSRSSCWRWGEFLGLVQQNKDTNHKRWGSLSIYVICIYVWLCMYL